MLPQTNERYTDWGGDVGGRQPLPFAGLGHLFGSAFEPTEVCLKSCMMPPEPGDTK